MSHEGNPDYAQPTPSAQAMTAEEFAARIHFMARDVIPRPTLTIGDVIDIVKERDALLLAAARQTWEAERSNLEITAASRAAKLLAIEAERAVLLRRIENETISIRLAVECGYRAAEKGQSLDQALRGVDP